MGRKSRSAQRNRPKPVAVADFETAQEEPSDGGLPDRTWVWLRAIAGVFDSELDLVGNSIDSFMEYALESAKLIYFHNLRFDGNFIIYWLLTTATSIMRVRFTPPIGGRSPLLSPRRGSSNKITVVTPDGIITDFQDSLKKIPPSVASMAKAYGLEMEKGRWITRRCVIPATFPRPRRCVMFVRGCAYCC